MAVYGFNEESIARTLKAFALKGQITAPPYSPSIPSPEMPFYPRKLFLAVITTEVTAATYTDKFKLGKGKAVILLRSKGTESDDDDILVAQTVEAYDDVAEETKVLDVIRDIFNFTKETIPAQVPTSTDPLELSSENELTLVAEDYRGDLFVIQGGGGGSSTKIGRTLEHIPGATGFMTNEDQANWDPPVDPSEDDDAHLKRPLKDVITVKRGMVWRLTVKPPPDPPDDPPVDWEPPDMELEDMVTEEEGAEPEDPPIITPVIEEWENPLFDAVLRNSIVLGTSFQGKTVIMSVAPTTIKEEPE